jgi:hypothetical protein
MRCNKLYKPLRNYRATEYITFSDKRCEELKIQITRDLLLCLRRRRNFPHEFVELFKTVV